MANLRVLLIDDDPSVNFLNKLIIEKSDIGAEIIEHTEADKALDQLANGQLAPDLILLDINMPVMNGWQFAESYEKLPETSRSSKVMILSSSINPSDKELAENSPVINGFFSKPLTIESVQQINQILTIDN